MFNNIWAFMNLFALTTTMTTENHLKYYFLSLLQSLVMLKAIERKIFQRRKGDSLCYKIFNTYIIYVDEEMNIKPLYDKDMKIKCMRQGDTRLVLDVEYSSGIRRL